MPFQLRSRGGLRIDHVFLSTFNTPIEQSYRNSLFKLTLGAPAASNNVNIGRRADSMEVSEMERPMEASTAGRREKRIMEEAFWPLGSSSIFL